jgi:hypothetical protein
MADTPVSEAGDPSWSWEFESPLRDLWPEFGTLIGGVRLPLAHVVVAELAYAVG